MVFQNKMCFRVFFKGQTIIYLCLLNRNLLVLDLPSSLLQRPSLTSSPWVHWGIWTVNPQTPVWVFLTIYASTAVLWDVVKQLLNINVKVVVPFTGENKQTNKHRCVDTFCPPGWVMWHEADVYWCGLHHQQCTQAHMAPINTYVHIFRKKKDLCARNLKGSNLRYDAI